MKTLFNIAMIPWKITGLALVVTGGVMLFGPHGVAPGDSFFRDAFWGDRALSLHDPGSREGNEW